MKTPRLSALLARAVSAYCSGWSVMISLALLAPAAAAAAPDPPTIAFHPPAAPAPVTVASFYSEECRGLPMANGRPFNPDRLTCASWDYPLGTVLEVIHDGRSVRVTVTDRGPARRLVARGVVIDLTRAAFASLGELDQGHLAVAIRVVRRA